MLTEIYKKCEIWQTGYNLERRNFLLSSRQLIWIIISNVQLLYVPLLYVWYGYIVVKGLLM